jgi:hypothetical protein
MWASIASNSACGGEPTPSSIRHESHETRHLDHSYWLLRELLGTPTSNGHHTLRHRPSKFLKLDDMLHGGTGPSKALLTQAAVHPCAHEATGSLGHVTLSAAKRHSHTAACRRCVRRLSTIDAVSETQREPLPHDDDSELKLSPSPELAATGEAQRRLTSAGRGLAQARTRSSC